MSPAVIDRFHGEYAFLSNFYPVVVEYEGLLFASVEHAYQGAKTLDPLEREQIRNARTAGAAKRLGRSVTLRADWNDVRLPTMRSLLEQKFTGPLRAALVATGDAELIEGNTWGDVFFGVCEGVGENHLGRMLMEIRAEIAP